MISVIISFILVIIGALNWLCIGFFQFDFVAGLFGSQASIFSRIIYILVGVAGVYLTYAVIRYKATLKLMGKRVDDDMDKAMHKVHKTANALTESSRELFDENEEKNTQNNHHNTKKSSSFEAGKHLDFNNYNEYSKGFDYKNSRRNFQDEYDDEDEDI